MRVGDTYRDGHRRWVVAEPSHCPEGHPLGPGLIVAVYLAGVYGGYFAAAQGVLLIGVLGVLLAQNLQMSDGLKNLLVGAVNLIAAIMYTIVAFDRIVWTVAGCIAVGALAGGWLGAKYGRLLSLVWLRAVVVALGLTALARMVTAWLSPDFRLPDG